MLIAAAELLEAEGRSLKTHALKTALAIGVAWMGLMFLGLGGGLLLYGLYLEARLHWGPIGALFFTAVLAISIGGSLLWLTKRLAR